MRFLVTLSSGQFSPASLIDSGNSGIPVFDALSAEGEKISIKLDDENLMLFDAIVVWQRQLAVALVSVAVVTEVGYVMIDIRLLGSFEARQADSATAYALRCDTWTLEAGRWPEHPLFGGETDHMGFTRLAALAGYKP